MMTSAVIPEELLALDAELDSAVPCEVHTAFGSIFREPCRDESTWIVRYREVCTGGKPLPLPGYALPVCAQHAAFVSRGTWAMGVCFCLGCMAFLHGEVYHLIANITPRSI